MKRGRIFRTMTLVIIFAWLAMVIPAHPCFAQTGNEKISVSPASITIDDDVNIDGQDFVKGKLVYFYFSSESASVGEEIDSEVENYEVVDSDTADSNGDVSVSFSIPDELNDGEDDEAVEGGTYYVYATYAASVKIVARYRLSVSIVRRIYLSPKKGAVGTEVKITGSGFGSSKNITVKYDTADITDDIVSGDTTTSGSGEFTSTINVPESANGDHTITVSVSSRSLATAKFTVEPKITISSTSGSIGDSVKVTGTGFASSKAVTITFDSNEVGMVETNFYGSFETTFSVPEAAPGSHDVKVEDGSNQTTIEFTVTTSINISPVTSQASPGHVGTVVTISGTGFKPNSTVTITYTSEPIEVATVTSEADGSFEATFGVPPSKAGEHIITASDGTISMKATFVMESTPPATPAPLLPYTGDKAEALAYFDWEDVTDASEPVTYYFQIATDANFTNVLVKKTGLTASEYTLTEEEALEPTSEDATYYWMVMAVDAASNASKWAGVGGFTVGYSSSGLTGWVLYTVIAVGACLFLFIGFWVVRRVLRRTVQETPLE